MRDRTNKAWIKPLTRFKEQRGSWIIVSHCLLWPSTETKGLFNTTSKQSVWRSLRSWVLNESSRDKSCYRTWVSEWFCGLSQGWASWSRFLNTESSVTTATSIPRFALLCRRKGFICGTHSSSRYQCASGSLKPTLMFLTLGSRYLGPGLGEKKGASHLEIGECVTNHQD